jgi:hypothetical protein
MQTTNEVTTISSLENIVFTMSSADKSVYSSVGPTQATGRLGRPSARCSKLITLAIKPSTGFKFDAKSDGVRRTPKLAAAVGNSAERDEIAT